MGPVGFTYNLLIHCHFCHFLKSSAVLLINGSEWSKAEFSIVYFSLFWSCLFSYSRVTGGSSLTDEVSLSEQLLQVIDDLIRMLPAARRLTLKDFPYAMAQTANEARAAPFVPSTIS